jgi:hypothetical protein
VEPFDLELLRSLRFASILFCDALEVRCEPLCLLMRLSMECLEADFSDNVRSCCFDTFVVSVTTFDETEDGMPTELLDGLFDSDVSMAEERRRTGAWVVPNVLPAILKVTDGELTSVRRLFCRFAGCSQWAATFSMMRSMLADANSVPFGGFRGMDRAEQNGLGIDWGTVCLQGLVLDLA